MRVFHHVRQVPVPRVLHGRLEDLPAVQVLRGSEVVPQVLDGLDVVLLLGGQDGVEGLQLKPQKHENDVRGKTGGGAVGSNRRADGGGAPFPNQRRWNFSMGKSVAIDWHE